MVVTLHSLVHCEMLFDNLGAKADCDYRNVNLSHALNSQLGRQKSFSVHQGN